MTRVLVVDDDPEQTRALSRFLIAQRQDITVVSAHNGATAMRLLQERRVDLILTDLQMPEMDGFALLAWVSNHCPDVSVFTMSAYGSGETATKTSNLGASEHFVKPLDLQALVARVSDVLNQSVHGQVHNVSLASFLQLLEMERKSCMLEVSSDDLVGHLVVNKGVLIEATTADLSGEAAAISIVAWPSPSIIISRTRELAPASIRSSLGYIVMEAMRIQDESAGVNDTRGDTAGPTAIRTWRPTGAPHDGAPTFESLRPTYGLPRGAQALALVETASGNVLRSVANENCPLGELASLAAQLLAQEAATLRLCSESEGVEELVLSTSSRCDLIRPIGASEFAMLVFAPDETNLVIARMELDHFVALHRGSKRPDAE